jgi:hypothetical protein
MTLRLLQETTGGARGQCLNEQGGRVLLALLVGRTRDWCASVAFPSGAGRTRVGGLSDQK